MMSGCGWKIIVAQPNSTNFNLNSDSNSATIICIIEDANYHR